MSIKCPKCQTDNPDTVKFCGGCGTQLPSPEDIAVTETLETPIKELTTGSTFAGRYQIIEELGKGGMGKVYRALDKKLNVEVALKLIKPEIAADKKTIERFKNELILARKIRHKNVGSVYELMEDKGTHFITMEYVPGQDLRGLIRQTGQLAVGTTINIAKQVCEGLSEAHRLGVVHRDLKPGNIMIDKEGNARIMDFGIARSLEAKGITGAGVMIGTPEYMSPEQVEGKETDQHSDIYSLGVIQYEMVTGRVPFEGETPLSIAVQHRSDIPKDPREINAQISEDISRMILRCLEKDKDKRYQSADEVRSELANIERSITTTKRIVPKKELETARTGEFGWQNSIAVLPFADLSPQKDQEYFCDGMAEELINVLTQVEDLRVVARTSVFAFKGEKLDVREIGKKLNVGTVLEGGVRKAGNRLRITAQLINVADGYHLWSERYDREMEDVFAIQDEVTQAIVEKLKVKFLREKRAKLVKPHTEDMEAYNLYLKGRYFLNKISRESIKKGMEYFQRAIENDPTYALAYVGLAASYSNLAFWGFLPPKDGYPHVKTFAKKALELDNTLAGANTNLAFASLLYDWDWTSAESGFKRAIELNPGNARAHFGYAHFLYCMVRLDEAIKEEKKALNLDPLSLYFRTILGVYLREAGRLDEAEGELNKVIEMEPTFGLAHYYLGWVYNSRGKYKEALAAFKKAIELTGGLSWAVGAHGFTYAILGERKKAEKVLHDLLELSKERYIRPSSIAAIYLGLGKVDETFEWYEKALKEHDTFMPLLKAWKTLPKQEESLRSDPRFKELLKKIGFDK